MPRSRLQPLKPDVGDNLTVDAILRTIADGLSGDPTLQTDPRQVQEIRQTAPQQQAPDVALARGAQQAPIVADVAHASQAMTSASQRGGKRA
jgi:hypothetical protein